MPLQSPKAESAYKKKELNKRIVIESKLKVEVNLGLFFYFILLKSRQH